MADTTEGARFWLPSEFFDDCLMAKENLDQDEGAESDSEFCFPTEFPYDFGTESEEQHVTKRRAVSTSPQTTLPHFEIWGGVPLPRTTPFGPVSKLILSGGDPTEHRAPPTKPYPSGIHNIYLEQQKQTCGMWYSAAAGRTWPIERRVGARTVLFGGGAAAVKRECAGTGVFLPRRYGNSAYSSDSRRRPVASISNRNVDALNKNLDNGFPQSQPHFRPNFSRGFVPEYDLMMARRNAIMLQHKRGMYLPQEWTY